MRPRLLSFGLVLLGFAAGLPLRAQDVEMLGEFYGTRPPDAYYEVMRRDPGAFRFSLEGSARLERLRSSPAFGQPVPAAPGGPTALTIGPRDGPVVGDFRFPLILGLYSDGPPTPPFPQPQIQQEFIDGDNSYFQTIPEFYSEMSRGLLQFGATSYPWVQTALTRDAVTQNGNGLAPTSIPGLGVGSFIEAILDEIDDGSIDWSEFDNDGDGYVDFIAVMHPTRGGECLGAPRSNIWSHRWSLDGVTSGRLSRLLTGKARDGYETTTPYAGGPGNIHINDYTIQAVLDCNSVEPPEGPPQINRIGVFAHELGHALGLPDLYSTADPGNFGTGTWDLMGTGAWGCTGTNDSARPCHFGAWSKAALGWVEVEAIGAGEDRIETLEPVETTGRVLLVPTVVGSSEYLLLENRQRLGSDVNLIEPGLLIWHIDPTIVNPGWPNNQVNTLPDRPGVWLRQADGKNDLTEGANRGDSGDPFPGCIRDDPPNPFLPCVRNPEFHVGTIPRAVTHAGNAMGIALTEIELLGEEPHDARLRVNTQFTWGELFVDAEIEAVKDQNVAFEIAGVPAESISWRLVGGTLPSGLSFDTSTGRLEGLTLETGDFDFVLGASQGPSQETQVFVGLTVVPPMIATEDLVNEFLGRPNTLSLPERQYLDQQGNRNGALADLGDVRAYLQANPGVLQGAPGEGSPLRVVVIPGSSAGGHDP